MSQNFYAVDGTPSRLAMWSVLMFVVVSCMAGGLFWVSQSASEYEDSIQAKNRALLNERQSIRVLEAEWAYLSRPQRIEMLVGMRGEQKPQADTMTVAVKASVPEAVTKDAEHIIKPEDKPAAVQAKARSAAPAPAPARVTPVAAPAPRQTVRQVVRPAPVQAAKKDVDVWPIQTRAAVKPQAQAPLYRPAAARGQMRPIIE